VTLRLTVLGSAGSHTGVGRMCSGYLVEHEGTRILLDAGNGSTANLQRSVAVRDLDAIAISHRHLDHCIDLVGCFYNARFDPEGLPDRIPLYAAAGVHDTLVGLLSEDSAMAFDEVFEHTEVADGDAVQVGGVTVRFGHSVHATPAVSMRIEVDGATLVYSGDSAGGPDLLRIAQGADLLLCEATWHGDIDDYPPGIHLTGAEAGRLAREAGVGRLLLTHIAGGSDRERIRREAEASFGRPVHLADDLETYELP
jgi:ribonuclease BN (tRNA processing enzyme)